MRELLVEQAAQPRQLVRVTQRRRVDRLVALMGEGAIEREIVVVAVARQVAGPPGTARIVVARAGSQLALDLLGAGGLPVILLMLGHAALERALRARGRALAAVALALALIGVLAFALGIVGLGVLLGLAEIEVEIVDEPAHGLGVGILVADMARELMQVAADAALQERSPHGDDALRGGRRRRAGERFARQQAHRLGQRHVVALAEMLVALAAIALVEHGGEIGGAAGHAPRAQRLDPRLPGALDAGARGLAARQSPRMKRDVVIAQLERGGVGGAAYGRRLGVAQIARRQRQAHPRAGGGGALEDLERRLVLGHALRPAAP